MTLYSLVVLTRFAEESSFYCCEHGDELQSSFEGLSFVTSSFSLVFITLLIDVIINTGDRFKQSGRNFFPI